MPSATARKKPSKKAAKKETVSASISSTERLEQLLKETEAELEKLDPRIHKLEKYIDELKELKLAKQKLITLKLSIQSILNNFSSAKIPENTTNVIKVGLGEVFGKNHEQVKFSTQQKLHSTSDRFSDKTFLPDVAFEQADGILRRKNSINYDLFRAIVFNGGRASTEEMKRYLVENGIRQPGNGQPFDDVELTDISSRVNYLVRKGIVEPDGRGNFTSCLGWSD